MSKKDVPRSHLENLHQHQSDDEDGTDTSSVYSDTSTPEHSPHLPSTCNNHRTTTYSRAPQPSHRWSSGSAIEVYAENNTNMTGEQIAGNVTASSLPLKGRFVFNIADNYNKGKLQNVGNVVFKNNKPTKISHDSSKKSHKKQSLNGSGSHSRNPKHHQCDDKSRGVPEPNVPSESNYAHRNLLSSTDTPPTQEPSQAKSSRRAIDQEIKDNKNSNGVQEIGNFTVEETSATAFFGGGGGVTQVIKENSNEGEVQRIANFKTCKDVDHDAR